ncbi:MAG: SpoIIIAH-like family protein [Clostridia bacterium]|nr:SpoIIIAH-like family protein [Clostridia bacterium]
MKKKSLLGKRGLLLGVLVLVLALVVYLNFYLNSQTGVQTVTDVLSGSSMGQAVYVNADSSAVSKEKNDYFANARTNRKSARAEAVAALQKIIDDPRSDQKSIADATAKSAQIAKDIATESNIETLVKAKGIADCVAVIGEESVTVVVKTEELLASDTMQIQEIVEQNTKFSLENIKIIEVK